MTVQRRKDVCLFSSARTLSNLLCHMLSAQPGFDQASYHFHSAFIKAMLEVRKGPEFITPELKVEVERGIQEGFENLQSDLTKAHENGNPIFVKNHANQLWSPFTGVDGENGPLPLSHATPISPGMEAKENPSMLPDDMMRSWIPVFIIRNPIMIGQSWYRTETRVKPLDLSSFNWRQLLSSNYIRVVFDWYMSLPEGQRTKPIVIDADDLVEDNRAINELCRQCGMDENSVLHEWETKQAPSDVDPHFKSYIGDLWNSKGVDKSKSSKGITLDGQYKVWREEFGEDVAEELRAYAEENMDNYMHMKSYKI